MVGCAIDPVRDRWGALAGRLVVARDDGWYWWRVEEYFGSGAPVEFTHAICPECEQKLYPSIVKS